MPLKPQLGCTYTYALHGVEAHVIQVEANIGAGLPGMYMVGMGDTAVRESRDRIKTAAVYRQLPWPKTKITINLSPAGLPKSGAHLDLAILLAVLTAKADDPDVHERLRSTLIVGEVGLDGSVRRAQGVLPAIHAAWKAGFHTILIPAENAHEAALLPDSGIYVVESVKEAFQWALTGVHLHTALDYAQAHPHYEPAPSYPDFADLAGQPHGRRVAEIAAAGGHHLMMIGPPGSGKSMVAARIPGILPELNPEETIECTTIHSVAGKTTRPVRHAPFVAPHHSISPAALIGGGNRPRPGAVSLAHRGVLFIDEASEMPARILNTLRTPLEEGSISLVRSHREVTFPARFQLILAANPCPCGNPDPRYCSCTPAKGMNYLDNIAEPIRDRIDIVTHIDSQGAVIHDDEAESSATIAVRVAEARDRARLRWRKAHKAALTNATIDSRTLRRDYPATEDAMLVLSTYLAQGDLTQRGVDRTLRVAWTLADLAHADVPTVDHVMQAMELHGPYVEVAAA